MKYDIIEIKKIIKNKFTYPSWTNNNSYPLKYSEMHADQIEVYYRTVQNKKYSRMFPNNILLSPKNSFILGLIKGEGANALGKSNYRRFTFTNSDWYLIKIVLDFLEKNGFLDLNKISNKSFHILHHRKSNTKAIKYWSEKLNISKKFFVCFSDKNLTSNFGVCHFYHSDVLLRRIIDLIIDTISFDR